MDKRYLATGLSSNSAFSSFLSCVRRPTATSATKMPTSSAWTAGRSLTTLLSSTYGCHARFPCATTTARPACTANASVRTPAPVRWAGKCGPISHPCDSRIYPSSSPVSVLAGRVTCATSASDCQDASTAPARTCSSAIVTGMIMESLCGPELSATSPRVPTAIWSEAPAWSRTSARRFCVISSFVLILSVG